MMQCDRHNTGLIELYFYGELGAAERARVGRHVLVCGECRRALDELKTIQVVLAGRPDVSAPADGDWAGFMSRLDAAVRREAPAHAFHAVDARALAGRSRPVAGYAAMAALLALVTLSVVFAWRSRERAPEGADTAAAPAVGTAPASAGRPASAGPQAVDRAFLSLSEQHFERSKLVVLGLATKDPADDAADWEYERELAARLLNDTRLYRLAAEDRGLGPVARVMQDLELVLLQAAMSDKPDASSLEQLQRIIRKRDLVTKMDVVTTTAGT